jgi:hypothetical protein
VTSATAPDDARVEREARRLLDRYLIEVVERFGLCPWAAGARARGEVHVEVLPCRAGPPAAGARIAADERAALGMVVLAASDIDPPALRRLRDAAVRPEVAIADFHPGGAGDLATPARLVPVLRRSPDPMLQVVRWSVLHAARRAPPPADRAAQARLLAGHAAAVPVRVDVADAIARANHATITAAGLDVLAAVLDDLARDRAAAYALGT